MRKLLSEVNLKVPTQQKIISNTVKLTRKLTTSGKILVKTGQRVNPEDVIAEGSRSLGFRSIPLAESLGVSGKDGAKYLKVAPGIKVYPEQVLAVKRKFFREVVIRNPAEGIVREYNPKTGVLLIESTTKREKLTAACWGQVLKIRDANEIEIETQATKVLGVEGTGDAREGQFRIIAKAGEFLLPTAITANLQGKIIFGGARITKGALGKAISLGLAGIVAGGINVEDFFRAGGGKTGVLGGSSDIGITLVILAGFGLRPVGSKIFEILTAFDGKFTIVDGDVAELIFPQSEAVTKPVEREALPKEKILAVGDIVRLTDPANLGLEGVVLTIADKKQHTPLGLKNLLVEIETSSGKMIQPITNLEILL